MDIFFKFVCNVSSCLQQCKNYKNRVCFSRVMITNVLSSSLPSSVCFASTLTPFIICFRRVAQVTCVCVVILSSCLSILLICIKNRTLFDHCMNISNETVHWYSVVLFFVCFFSFCVFIVFNFRVCLYFLAM